MRIRYPAAVSFALRREGIRSYEELIHHQPKEWLIRNFSANSRDYPVNVTLLAKNMIWQMRERVLSGERRPYAELIRTYWYAYFKPVLSRCDSVAESAYQILSDEMAKLVRAGLMKYSDIGFRDFNRAHRLVGENTNIIIVAEKLGHLDYLMDLHEKFRVSIIAHGGQPSLLNNEYFVESIKSKAHLGKSFYIFTIGDYDPVGRQIGNTFIGNLNFFGIKNVRVRDLVHPDVLTPEQVKLSRYRLRDTRRTREWHAAEKKKNYKNAKFLKETRRVGRKTVTDYFGLMAESVTTENLDKKIKQYMLPILGRAEDYLKEYELNNLEGEIRNLILYKMIGR